MSAADRVSTSSADRLHLKGSSGIDDSSSQTKVPKIAA